MIPVTKFRFGKRSISILLSEILNFVLFLIPRVPKARSNKTGVNIMILILLLLENVYITIQYMFFFQYG